MATRRMITSDIWRDDWFGELDFFQQNLWIGLFSACADDQGRLRDNPALIRADLYPFRDINLQDIETALAKFAADGKIIRYKADDKSLIQIANWWEHQKPQWAQPSKWAAPEGWRDRIRTRMNGEYIETNWADSALSDDTSPETIAEPSAEASGETFSRTIQVNCSGEQSSRTIRVGRQYPDPDPDPIQNGASAPQSAHKCASPQSKSPPRNKSQPHDSKHIPWRSPLVDG